MSKKPIQPQDKYVLRFPDGLRDELRQRAEANNRSLNAEIVLRLQRSLWLEENGILTEKTTIADLLQPPTGEQLVKTIRSLKQKAADMVALLEAEENQEILQSAKDYVRQEKSHNEGRGTSDKPESDSV